MARSVGIDRAQVVATAAELADAHGLDQLALAQVAARLGVRLPSLYNHVDGLAGLRHELALLGLRGLLERMGHAAIGKAEDTAVIAVAQAYRSYVVEHPGLYAATVRAPAPGDRDRQQLSQSIVEVVLAVLAPYGLDEQGAIHAVRGLRSIAHGFATIELAGGFGMALDRDESYMRLLRAYVAGLRASGGGH
ncbi:MAG: WHG domain-containing protein [Kouleothrix sp.]|nr:WHG domain-containing protein [Kouleothrix sp.]